MVAVPLPLSVKLKPAGRSPTRLSAALGEPTVTTVKVPAESKVNVAWLVLAKSGTAGIQSACWDLRVNPNQAPPSPDGRGRAGETPAPTERAPNERSESRGNYS